MDLRGNEGDTAPRYVKRRGTFYFSGSTVKTAELLVHSYIRSLVTTGYSVLCGIPQFLSGSPTLGRVMSHVQSVEPQLRRALSLRALCNYNPLSTTSYEHTGCSGTFFPPCRAANKTLNTARSSSSTGPTRSPSNKENHPRGLVEFRASF